MAIDADGETGAGPPGEEFHEQASAAADTKARRTRFIAAALTGTLWTASGVVSSATAHLPVPAALAALAVPRTVELDFGAYPAGRSPLPEQWLSALAAGVLVAALTAMLLQSLSRRQPRIPPFQAVWVCTALAAVAGGLVLGLGGMLDGWPAPRPARFFEALVQFLLAGAHWGALWGWLPALVAARGAAAGMPVASPRTGTRHHRARSFIFPAAVTLLAGAVALAVLPSADRPPDRPPGERQGGWQAAPQPVPEAVPEPAPEAVVYGAELTGHPFKEPDPDWCTGHEVRMMVDGWDAGLGSRVGRLTLEVTGGRSCVVHAYPDLDFNRTDGWAMDITPVHGGSMMTRDTVQDPFVLEPGQFAEAGIGWRATAGAGMSRVGTLLVAPYSGTLRQALEVDLDLTEPGFLTVTSWVPAGPDAPPPGTLRADWE